MRKFLNLFLLVLGFICQQQQSSVVGHFVPTKTNENMNGEYLISNPNPNAGKTWSSLYGSRPNIEYFDVYSPPISTKYVLCIRFWRWPMAIAKEPTFLELSVAFVYCLPQHWSKV